MTTCRDIITYALNLAKVVGPGKSPTSRESDFGLVALQSMYDAMVANGLFGELEDVYLEEDDTAEEGKRYFVPTGITLTAPTSIYLDADGNTRQPRDLSIYESLTEAGTRTVKIYDRTQWVAMTGLALSSDAPLAGRGAMGLAALLATSGAFIAAFGDQGMSPAVQMLARQFNGSLIGKQGTTQDSAGVDYF